MFPTAVIGGGGTSFQQFNPGYATNNTSSASLVTVVSVTGSGILVGLSQSNASSGAASGTLKITIDGTVVINDTAFSLGSTSVARNTELTCLYAFKSSLLIEHANTNALPVITKISYLVN